MGIISHHASLLLLGIVSLLSLAAADSDSGGRSKFLAEKIVARQATVQIDTSSTIYRVADGFLCATLDWWPAAKCDYGTCSWKGASLLNLDLTHPLLENAIKALSPLTLRLGGSLQDRIFYKVGKNANQPCSDFIKQQAIFGFSEGCLNMSRWVALNQVFQRAGASVVFGLNALYGRQRVSKGVYSGAWDPSNARDFIKYTHDQKIPIQAWELGNELSANGVGTTINSHQYAADVKALREIIEDVYSSESENKPLVVAPDGFFVASWYQQLLQATGPQVLDAITRHIYNLGSGMDQHLIQKILNPTYLSQEAGAFKQMKDTVSRYGPWAQAWIGEAGGAYNSGQHLVNDAFVSSFWYLDQLGMAASHNTAVYCRQSLVGGNYALLQTNSFNPNPDYYSALLWKQLMGNDVLPATVIKEAYLRAYAHCAKSNSGGLSVLLINFSNSTVYGVTLELMGYQSSQIKRSRKAAFQQPRLEYHLSAPETDLKSQNIHLNGELLSVTEDGNIPVLKPKAVSASKPITIAPLSIAFVVVPDAQIQACSIGM